MLEIKLNLEHTLTCGQVFRFKKTDEGYTVFSKDKVAYCIQNGDIALIKTEDEDYFYTYFDGDTDYSEIHSAMKCDETVSRLSEKYKGLRLLKQDLWEMTMSFIVSQNNNIPRIQGIVERLCEKFGEKTEHGYAFPSPSALYDKEPSDLSELKCGYRDSYLLDAAKKFHANEIDAELILKGDINKAREELFKIKGIGPKVADCVLLFGAGRMDAFPVDTWMKKALSTVYGIEVKSPTELRTFSEQKFGKFAGYAQQYLFFGARTGDI